MIDRTTKLRWRRRFRRSRRQVEDIGLQAEQQLEQHFVKRLNRLWDVRRFILAWILLFVLLLTGVIMQTRALSKHYQTLQPTTGGVYTEGILGSFTNANPLYATGSVDGAVARLVFAGLFEFDQHNQLVGDLAEKWEVDEKGTNYTVTLKPDLTWHDGHPLTSADVVFTYQTIQNPDAKSPLANSWQGITVTAVDERTVQFKLPNSLSAFPYSMTNGIVPKHLLEGIPMTQLRSIAFNTNRPVGAGPFKWEAIEVSGITPESREERIGLVPFDDYAKGAPKLSRFVIRTFRDESRLLTSFNNQEVTAIVGLERASEEFAKNTTIQEYNLPLTSAVMVFFKTTQGDLVDPNIRRALVLASNTNEIISGLGYPVIAVRGPFLKDHIGYNNNLVQPPYNTAEANALLDKAGWQPGSDGIRVKNGKPLGFRLYSQSTSEYAYVTQVLQKQWRAAGVNVEVILMQDNDLKDVLANHEYDALLYGISLGIDPDVFAFWHSSQANILSPNRLNLSEYKSTAADRALEAGRTRSDPALRAIKYQPFLEAWRNDNPAIALYQPNFLYITNGKIHGLDSRVINTGIDRYANVENWMIRQVKTNK